jgi:hypothetical protein
VFDLKLEPYTARLRWQTREGMINDELSRLVGEFVDTLARLCDGAGRCLIGHIKGFAALPDGGFIRVNAVSSRMPADVTVHSSEPIGEFTMTLNVLVYGHPADLLQRLTEEAANETAARFGSGVNSLDHDHLQHHQYHEH